MPSGPGRASHTARAQPDLGGAEAVPQRRRQQRPEPLVESPTRCATESPAAANSTSR